MKGGKTHAAGSCAQTIFWIRYISRQSKTLGYAHSGRTGCPRCHANRRGQIGVLSDTGTHASGACIGHLTLDFAHARPGAHAVSGRHSGSLSDQCSAGRRAHKHSAGDRTGQVQAALCRARTPANTQLASPVPAGALVADCGGRGALRVPVGTGFSPELSAHHGIFADFARTPAGLCVHGDGHRAGAPGYHPAARSARPVSTSIRI